MKRYFVTGIGTGVGKTFMSAILTEALQADYWKPVQCGVANGTDKERVSSLISNNKSIFHKESAFPDSSKVFKLLRTAGQPIMIFGNTFEFSGKPT